MFGNPVQGPRVVPFGAARTAADRLPNGRPSFRVTQRFSDLDAFFRDRIHGAMDLGNFYCGDAVLAMEGGHAVHVKDAAGALGIRITHPNGYRSEYWHLSSRKVGSGVSVGRGQHIGGVGSTGLDIGGCHLHVVVLDPQGRKVDPWPLLDQNIVAYRILKGYPINIRQSPGGAIYATSTAAGIKRSSDGKVIAPNNQKMRFGGSVKHTDGYWWDRVYLASAYRYVRSDLLLKA